MTNNILNTPMIMAGFYYRGVDVILKPEICQVEELVQTFEKNLRLFYKEIESDGPEFFFEQLEALIQIQLKEGGFSTENAILWCQNIYWLTQLGHLTNDEFIGTSFMYGSLD